jgi:hypothetical protein
MVVLLMLCLSLAAEPAEPDVIRQIAESGRVVELGTPPSERVSPPPQIAPGAPPLLSFRLFEGKLRSRYGNLDLVLDDAGH